MPLQDSYRLSNSQLIRLAISYAPKSRHSELERLVLQLLVEASSLTTLVDSLLDGQSVQLPALDLCLTKLREADVPIPDVFEQIISSLSTSTQQVREPAVVHKTRKTPKQSTPAQQQTSRATVKDGVLLSRKQRRHLILAMNRDLPCDGIYSRYGCDSPVCNRCLNIFVSYPVSKCSVVHANSESCNEIGLYPHISHQKWRALHACKTLPAMKIAKGCYRNPQSVFQLRYIRSQIKQKLKRYSAPSIAENQDVTPKQAERDEVTVVAPQPTVSNSHAQNTMNATVPAELPTSIPSMPMNEPALSKTAQKRARKAKSTTSDSTNMSEEPKKSKPEESSVEFDTSDTVASALLSFCNAPSAVTLAASLSRLVRSSKMTSSEQRTFYKHLGRVLPDDM